MSGVLAMAVPLPPDFELHGRKCLGFLPCLRGCGEFMPVFAGKRKFYASCSPKFVTVRHCKAEYGQPDLADFPAQTKENAEKALSENPDIPGEYLEIIKQAWGIEHERREIPGIAENRGEEYGNSGISDVGNSEIVAATDDEEPGNSGNQHTARSKDTRTEDEWFRDTFGD